MIIEENTCRMLNNNKTESRNFANQPFSSNSTFHRVSRDSPFYDSSFKKSRLTANRPTLSVRSVFSRATHKTGRKIFIQNDSIPCIIHSGGYISIDKPSGGNVSETHLNPRQFALFKYGFNRYSSC